MYNIYVTEIGQSSRSEGVFDGNLGKLLLNLYKTYVVTPHLNRLVETVQMRGHNIWFR